MIKNKNHRNNAIHKILQNVINNLNLDFNLPIIYKNHKPINTQLPIVLVYEINNETVISNRLSMQADLKIHIISNFNNQIPLQFMQHLHNYFILSYQNDINFDNLQLQQDSDLIKNFADDYYGTTVHARIFYRYPNINNVSYNHNINAKLIID